MMLNQYSYFFQTEERETGKSHLVKVIYNAISKTSLYYCKTLQNQGFFNLDLQEDQQNLKTEPQFILVLELNLEKKFK